jgi:hypothetical protein
MSDLNAAATPDCFGVFQVQVIQTGLRFLRTGDLPHVERAQSTGEKRFSLKDKHKPVAWKAVIPSESTV